MVGKRLKHHTKSVIIMLLYDALIFGLSSYFWYAKFNLASKMLIPAVLLIVATGLFTLFLKANYKIREFNNTLKNCYLLFEGVIFSQIPTAILLAFFNLNFSIVGQPKRELSDTKCKYFNFAFS